MIHRRWIVRRTFAALLPAMLSVASASAWADEPIAPWFAQLMARFAVIPERREAFHEEKRLSELNRSLSSEGLLVYRRPSYLEKVTVAPRKEILLVDDDQLTLTGPDGAPHELSLSSRPEISMLVDAVRGTLSGDIGQLEHSYALRVAGDAQGWQLVLRPMNPRVQEMLQDIVIRGNGTAIHSVLTEQINGDSQLLTVQRLTPESAGVLQSFSGALSGDGRPLPAATAQPGSARLGPKP